MAITPRRIRQLPPAQPASSTDVFPVSQMNTETGVATTRAMSRDQLQSDLIDVINQARQEFVNTANSEHTEIREWLNDLQNRVEDNETTDSNIQTAIAMVQQMIAEGDGGKSAYQLWLELPGNAGKTVQQYFDAMTGPPGTTKWAGITDKPSTFPPSEHTHPISDVIGAQAALDSKSDKVHTHNQGEIVGLNDALDAASAPNWNAVTGKPLTYPPSQHSHAWADITSKPSTFPPSAHTQAISTITGLQTALDGKSPVGHTHPISEISGLQAALDGKIPGAVVLGEVDVVDQAVVVLGLGVRSKDVTVPASWGLRTTDTLFVTAATSLPVGYAIDNAIPLTTTSIRVYFVGPALALLASNTLRVRVAAIARTS